MIDSLITANSALSATPLHAVGDRVAVRLIALVKASHPTPGGTVYDLDLHGEGRVVLPDVPEFRVFVAEG